MNFDYNIFKKQLLSFYDFVQWLFYIVENHNRNWISTSSEDRIRIKLMVVGSDYLPFCMKEVTPSNIISSECLNVFQKER
jgi:hypothetical protein